MLRTVVFASLAACALAVSLNVVSQSDLTVHLQDHTNGGLDVIVQRKNSSNTLMWIGRNAGAATAASSGNGEVVVNFASNQSVRISSRQILEPRKGHVISIEWTAPVSGRLVDCLNLGSIPWYGGPQQKRQLWPIDQLVLPEYSYVTKEADNCGIAEPYWLGSQGIYLFLDKKVPLFVDQNVIQQNTTCFVAEVKAPYSTKRNRLEMSYVIGIFDNVREAHEHAVATVLGKPTGYPDEKMLKSPIWSTWARYKSAVNHDVVLAFADEINRYNFTNSQFEIDDLWEICYGSLTVDVARFPNMSNTVSALKAKGFRVTIWMHPFMNKNCEPWYTDALNDGYLVVSEDGSEETSWWNDNGTTAAYVDYTKPEARKWYSDRVQMLHDQYGIDSFKFDGGESSWSPQIPVLQSDIDGQPSAITTEYVKSVAQFGSMVEVRSGYRTQNLPIFVRMIDKDSYFTFENGLPTLITTLLQMNLNGYTLVLPDMIGGNGYNNTTPSKELFIRWLQANVFMPSMQFSYVPWDYDNETVLISRELVALHERYTPDIIKACQRSVAEGAPVNAPVWWIAPNDTTAHAIWDEFLLGEDILAAPVVTQGATTRDIYIPIGRWLEQGNTSSVHEGPIWIRNYPAPLNVLPYFIRDHRVIVNSASTSCVAILLVLLGLVINIYFY
ncbi:myogenesis-regulating glycosidase-like isoform X2 [Maniola hyperantus]|uniref:myogenesis-regulating glycosidase-like isoform X2 n=1 Tax=Aphantopus hyperantus TaxID=2795564 RepID=UPI00156A400E|nr:myogenesis-regulating glycosidase-like [Maniola hyperantus]